MGGERSGSPEETLPPPDTPCLARAQPALEQRSRDTAAVSRTGQTNRGNTTVVLLKSKRRDLPGGAVRRRRGGISESFPFRVLDIPSIEHAIEHNTIGFRLPKEHEVHN